MCVEIPGLGCLPYIDEFKSMYDAGKGPTIIALVREVELESTQLKSPAKIMSVCVSGSMLRDRCYKMSPSRAFWPSRTVHRC
jgi:hypothetical protein